MPVLSSAPVGAPIWIDLASSDVERSQVFYSTVFGWTFESAGPEYGGYINAFSYGKPVAGLMHNDPQWNSPDGWTTYLHTADMKATLDKAMTAGAIACAGPPEPMQVGDRGWMGMLSDPTGAFFGPWQPAGHRGFEVVNAVRCSAGSSKPCPTPTSSATAQPVSTANHPPQAGGTPNSE